MAVCLSIPTQELSHRDGTANSIVHEQWMMGSTMHTGHSTRLLTVSDRCPPAMAQRNQWNLSELSLVKQVGSGAASCVHYALCRRTHMPLAVKMYEKAKLSTLNLHQVEREIRIHSTLSHPHVVDFYAAFEDEQRLYLLMEFAAGGDLFDEVKRRGGRLSEREVVTGVLAPYLDALSYLHSRGVIHRDIKPENTVFTRDGQLKVADFGLAIHEAQERPVTRLGTLDYMSPEVLRCPDKQLPADNKDRHDLVYGPAVDCWALGVLAYELLVGRPPFGMSCRDDTMRAICAASPQIPFWISQAAASFIMAALNPNPAYRPSISALRSHPWITSCIGNPVPAVMQHPPAQQASHRLGVQTRLRHAESSLGTVAHHHHTADNTGGGIVSAIQQPRQPQGWITCPQTNMHAVDAANALANGQLLPATTAFAAWAQPGYNTATHQQAAGLQPASMAHATALAATQAQYLGLGLQGALLQQTPSPFMAQAGNEHAMSSNTSMAVAAMSGAGTVHNTAASPFYTPVAVSPNPRTGSTVSPAVQGTAQGHVVLKRSGSAHPLFSHNAPVMQTQYLQPNNVVDMQGSTVSSSRKTGPMSGSNTAAATNNGMKGLVRSGSTALRVPCTVNFTPLAVPGSSPPLDGNCVSPLPNTNVTMELQDGTQVQNSMQVSPSQLHSVAQLQQLLILQNQMYLGTDTGHGVADSQQQQQQQQPLVPQAVAQMVLGRTNASERPSKRSMHRSFSMHLAPQQQQQQQPNNELLGAMTVASHMVNMSPYVPASSSGVQGVMASTTHSPPTRTTGGGGSGHARSLSRANSMYSAALGPNNVLTHNQQEYSQQSHVLHAVSQQQQQQQYIHQVQAQLLQQHQNNQQQQTAHYLQPQFAELSVNPGTRGPSSKDQPPALSLQRQLTMPSVHLPMTARAPSAHNANNAGLQPYTGFLDSQLHMSHGLLQNHVVGLPDRPKGAALSYWRTDGGGWGIGHDPLAAINTHAAAAHNKPAGNSMSTSQQAQLGQLQPGWAGQPQPQSQHPNSHLAIQVQAGGTAGSHGSVTHHATNSQWPAGKEAEQQHEHVLNVYDSLPAATQVTLLHSSDVITMQPQALQQDVSDLHMVQQQLAYTTSDRMSGQQQYGQQVVSGQDLQCVASSQNLEALGQQGGYMQYSQQLQNDVADTRQSGAGLACPTPAHMTVTDTANLQAGQFPDVSTSLPTPHLITGGQLAAPVSLSLPHDLLSYTCCCCPADKSSVSPFSQRCPIHDMMPENDAQQPAVTARQGLLDDTHSITVLPQQSTHTAALNDTPSAPLPSPSLRLANVSSESLHTRHRLARLRLDCASPSPSLSQQQQQQQQWQHMQAASQSVDVPGRPGNGSMSSDVDIVAALLAVSDLPKPTTKPIGSKSFTSSKRRTPEVSLEDVLASLREYAAAESLKPGSPLADAHSNDNQQVNPNSGIHSSVKPVATRNVTHAAGPSRFSGSGTHDSASRARRGNAHASSPLRPSMHNDRGSQRVFERSSTMKPLSHVAVAPGPCSGSLSMPASPSQANTAHNPNSLFHCPDESTPVSSGYNLLIRPGSCGPIEALTQAYHKSISGALLSPEKVAKLHHGHLTRSSAWVEEGIGSKDGTPTSVRDSLDVPAWPSGNSSSGLPDHSTGNRGTAVARQLSGAGCSLDFGLEPLMFTMGSHDPAASHRPHAGGEGCRRIHHARVNSAHYSGNTTVSSSPSPSGQQQAPHPRQYQQQQDNSATSPC